MKKYWIFILVGLFLPFQNTFAQGVEEVKLASCVDGDTAKFQSADGTIKKYRFLAIETPETQHPTKGVEAFGKEASDYTCETLATASKIVLEFDEKASAEDSYGRGLAWIFVDDVLLQKQLVSLGYAKVAYLYGDYKYTSLLQEAEKVARENQFGVWSISENDSLKTEAQEDTHMESTTLTSSGNFLEDFLNSILDAITASINKMIDSILQKLESML